MRKTYRVYFVDHNGCYNQKLLEADDIKDIHNYMFTLGYIANKIEEVEQ